MQRIYQNKLIILHQKTITAEIIKFVSPLPASVTISYQGVKGKYKI